MYLVQSQVRDLMLEYTWQKTVVLESKLTDEVLVVVSTNAKTRSEGTVFFVHSLLVEDMIAYDDELIIADLVLHRVCVHVFIVAIWRIIKLQIN